MRTAEAEYMITAIVRPQNLMFVMVAHGHFLFNFVIEIITKIAASLPENNGVAVCPDGKLSELEYADHVVLLCHDSEQPQVFRYRFSDGLNIFGVFCNFGLRNSATEMYDPKFAPRSWNGGVRLSE